MGKKTNAEEVLSDIRGGLSDSALMEKHGLSEKGLESLLGKLVAAGLLSQSELDQKRPEPTTTPANAWKCPACGMPQTRRFEECPRCGVIVAKYEKQQKDHDIRLKLSPHTRTGGMKSKKSPVDALFRDGKNGRKLFFPWGAWGRGYVIPSDEEYRRIRRGVTLRYSIGGPCLIAAGIAIMNYFEHTTGSLWTGICWYLVLAIPYGAWHWAWFRRQWSAMEETDEPYHQP